MPRLSPLAFALGGALLLAGCASSAGLAPQGTPRDAATLEAGRALSGAPLSAAAWPAERWWTAFGDTQLDALIDEALAGSPSLDAAAARVRKAQAQAGLAEAARKPSVGGSAQYAVAQLPAGLAGEDLGGQLLHNAVLTLKFDWPLDVWGGKRADAQAALGQARASEVDAQAARLSLAANVARSYVALAQAFDDLGLARREQARADDLVTLGKQRIAAGLDNQAALRGNEAMAAAAKAQADAAQQRIDALRNALAALLGQGPDRGLAIQRPHLLETPAPALPSVLPSELLGHRPDVVAARWRVEAAAQGITSAKARFRPSIDLSGLVGLAATGFSGLFDSDAFLGFGGPALSLPIFDGGQLRSNLAARDADYDLAVADYNRTVVDGLRQVTDAVQAIRALDAQAAALEQARKPLLQAEQQLAAVRSLRYAAAIDLDQALGGGIAATAPAPIASH